MTAFSQPQTPSPTKSDGRDGSETGPVHLWIYGGDAFHHEGKF